MPGPHLPGAHPPDLSPAVCPHTTAQGGAGGRCLGEEQRGRCSPAALRASVSPPQHQCTLGSAQRMRGQRSAGTVSPRVTLQPAPLCFHKPLGCGGSRTTRLGATVGRAWLLAGGSDGAAWGSLGTFCHTPCPGIQRPLLPRSWARSQTWLLWAAAPPGALGLDSAPQAPPPPPGTEAPWARWPGGWGGRAAEEAERTAWGGGELCPERLRAGHAAPAWCPRPTRQALCPWETLTEPLQEAPRH